MSRAVLIAVLLVAALPSIAFANSVHVSSLDRTLSGHSSGLILSSAFTGPHLTANTGMFLFTGGLGISGFRTHLQGYGHAVIIPRLHTFGDDDDHDRDDHPAVTPEPGTLVLLGTGLLTMAGIVRRKLHSK